MLISRRIASLQQLEKQLRRAVRIDGINKPKGSHRHNRDLSAVDARTNFSAMKDKILFRSVPIVLSLIERSFLPVERAKQSTLRKTAWENRVSTVMPADGGSVALLSSNGITNGVEMVCNGNLVTECFENATPNAHRDLKGHRQPCSILSHPKTMLRLFTALHFVEGQRRQHYHHNMDRLASKMDEAQRKVRATKEHGSPSISSAGEAQIRVKEIKGDIAILRGSLLARSYLSARLWKLLLREELWEAAIEESGASNGEKNSPIVLLLLLSFNRLVFGVLQDVVQGHHLNKRSPRFVASLPSRRRRNMEETTFPATNRGVNPDKREPYTPCLTPSVEATAEKDDSMITMMLGDIAVNTAKSIKVAEQNTGGKPPGSNHSPKIKSKSTISSVTSLKWMPPAACDAMPLVVKTLALSSELLSRLSSENIANQWKQTAELFELLVVLQSTARLLLAVAGGSEEEADIHNVLRHLERTMLECGERAKTVLSSGCGDCLLPLTAVQALRLLLALDSLKLLSMSEPRSHDLIMRLVSRVFPQLSTGTQSALIEKSRQTSLFAFATRGHRAKLYRAHGRDAAADVALHSVRSQARLLQRQMQAALRAKHMDQINSESVSNLTQQLPVHSFIAGFSLLSRTAMATRFPEAQTKLITASLFMLEGVFGAASLSSHEHDAYFFHPNDLAALIVALSLLWPLCHDRCGVQRSVVVGRRTRTPPRKCGGNGALERSEIIMVRCATDVVFRLVNASLAERVEFTEGVPLPAANVGKKQLLTPAQVVSIVTALAHWCDVSYHTNKIPQVVTAAQLVKRLVLSDVGTWKEVRLLNDSRREEFLRVLVDVMGLTGATELSITEIISSI
uniref:Uncharacterized protein n=1 Tax=Trypanosoma congolense (strain IL3000) TaxID=1068625 RepID=G0UXB8_TRYCI|nr:conserved hypothetical protein [Trypanosoma congolense IL3000]